MNRYYLSKKPICKSIISSVSSVISNEPKQLKVDDKDLPSATHCDTGHASETNSSGSSTTNTSIFNLSTNPDYISVGKIISVLKHFRAAKLNDNTRINSLLTNETFEWFGQFQMDVLLCQSIYTFIIEDQIGRFALFMTLRNSPNIPALHPADWLDWIKYHYSSSLKNITYENTLFVNYFAQGLRYDPLTYQTIFKELFLKEIKLRYIIFVVPPMVEEGFYDHILLLSCIRVFPDEASTFENRCQSLYVCHRYKSIPKMSFRQAIPEDNDDILNILNVQHKRVSEELGDFYIAEEILSNPNSHGIIVAEINYHTVGVIWLDKEVDVEKLNKCLHLGLYNRLKKYEDKCEYEYIALEELLKKDSEQFFNNLVAQSEDYVTDSSLDSRVSFDWSCLTRNEFSYYNLGVFKTESDYTNFPDDDILKKWNVISKMLHSESHYSRMYGFNCPIPETRPSAFAIKLFGFDPSVDKRRVYDLLGASFSLLPNNKYGIILISSVCPHSLNAMYSFFTRVTPRSRSELVDTCYIAHRSPILGYNEIHYVEVKDVPDIDSMINGPSSTGNEINQFAPNIMEMVLDYLSNPKSPYYVMMIRCNKLPVGFIIVRNALRVDLLFKYYNIDEFNASEKGSFDENERVAEILCLHVHPSFDWEAYYIFREIYRLTGLYELLYILTSKVRISNKLISEMYSVHQRGSFELFTIDDYLIQQPKINNDELTPCPIYFQTVPLAQLPRVRIETNILIIGFDETCKAFLESLLFSKEAKKIKFTKISVILDPGVYEAEFSDTSPIAEELLYSRLIHNRHLLKKLRLQAIVNFVSYPLTSINRCSKSVVVGENYRLYYDYLFLFASTTYGYPPTVRDNALIPINYSHATNCLEAVLLQNKIALLKEYNLEVPIIIYGNTKGAHACLNYILKAGIDESTITMVIPNNFDRREFDRAFENELIKDIVENLERKAGVKVYNGYTFVRWNLDRKNSISTVVFDSKIKSLTLSCGLLISYDYNLTNFGMLEIFRKCGLITVGNYLEIDQNCLTKDKSIYAAGPFTIYNEKLLASKWNHKYFNKFEIGSWLGLEFVKNKIFATNTNTNKNNVKQKFVPSIPKFIEPVCQYSKLIHDYTITEVKSPGKYLPSEVANIVHVHGYELSTLNKDGDHAEYTQLTLNEYGLIVSLTSLTRKKKEFTYLRQIYGYHEKLLNNLRYRYENNQIPDLLEFLYNPWIYVIFNDMFQDFLIGSLELIKESVELVVERDVDPDKDKELIFAFLKKHNYEEALHKRFFDFLKMNAQGRFTYT